MNVNPGVFFMHQLALPLVNQACVHFKFWVMVGFDLNVDGSSGQMALS